MDQVQALAAAHAEDALKRHAARPKPRGLTHCDTLECRQPIHPLRQAHGAVLCIDCQVEEEDAQRRQTKRGHR
jgi:hypothetical protein